MNEPEPSSVEAAARRVIQRVTQRGPGPSLTETQIRRLAVEWGPLAGALAELLAAAGEPVPAPWVVARQRWGCWR